MPVKKKIPYDSGHCFITMAAGATATLQNPFVETRLRTLKFIAGRPNL